MDKTYRITIYKDELDKLIEVVSSDQRLARFSSRLSVLKDRIEFDEYLEEKRVRPLPGQQTREEIAASLQRAIEQ